MLSLKFLWKGLDFGMWIIFSFEVCILLKCENCAKKLKRIAFYNFLCIKILEFDAKFMLRSSKFKVFWCLDARFHE